MAYVLTAVGWVPNISGKVTSSRHISERVGVPSNGMVFQFIPETRRVHVDHGIEGFPDVEIRLLDDSGLCHLLIEEGSCYSDLEKLGDMELFKVRQHLGTIWMTFRGWIDSSTDPKYSPPRYGAYTTEVAKHAICTAMNFPILITELEDVSWADAIAARFVQHDEAMNDNLRSYPRAHIYWSDPRHFWNRRRVINRALNTSAMSSTDAIYFRSFISMYSAVISDVETVERKLDLRNERMAAVSRFVEERMESTSLGWLLLSVAVAVIIGAFSLVFNIWFRGYRMLFLVIIVISQGCFSRSLYLYSRHSPS